MTPLEDISHPVHFVHKSGRISPSAFIPFCAFGSDMSSLAVKIDQFDVPVCNSFQAKVMNDQLCYEVDLDRLSNRNNIEFDLNPGFIFFMDYNEDRQLTFNQSYEEASQKTIAGRVVKVDDHSHASIIIDAIGSFV